MKIGKFTLHFSSCQNSVWKEVTPFWITFPCWITVTDIEAKWLEAAKEWAVGTIFLQHTTATSNKNQMHLLKRKFFSVLLILLINTKSPIKVTNLKLKKVSVNCIWIELNQNTLIHQKLHEDFLLQNSPCNQRLNEARRSSSERKSAPEINANYCIKYDYWKIESC